MGELRPRLSDIRISFDLISKIGKAGHLDPEAFSVLATLVATCAAKLCWTYTAPGDGSLPDDDEMLRRYAMVSKRRWARLRPVVAEYFVVKKGRWHLDEPWIAIDERPARFAIPLALQRAILEREGKVCTYCGDTEGPFDFDHIYPVSRGGPNIASNLTLACASCNRSKGAKTLREWMGQ